MTRAYKAVSRLYRCNAQGKILEDISHAVTRAGKIVASQDTNVPWVYTATLRNVIDFAPFVNFVKPYYKIIFEDGEVLESWVGMYAIPPFSRSHLQSESTYNLVGQDLTWYAQGHSEPDIFSVTTADDPIEVMTERLIAAGVPENMIFFATKNTDADDVPAPVHFPRNRDWPPDTDTMKICNDICSIIGYYAIGPDDSGRIGSEPFRNYDAREPDAHYFSGVGSAVVGEIKEEEPPLTSFANEIVVRPSQPQLDTTGADDDTGSPNPANGRTVKVTERLRLRESGTLSAPIILVMPVGTPGKVTGTSVSADGYTWWPVTMQVPGMGSQSGWSAGNWLQTVTGDPDPVTQPEEVVTPIVARRQNLDPNSPISITTLGKRWVRTFYDSKIETQAQAEEQADRLFSETQTFYRKLTMPTLPDPRRRLHEMYQLDIYNKRGVLIADGKWLCRGWELPLDGMPMTHTIYRYEPWSREVPNG